jgi:fibronectin-binding autotransporter adhesin
MMKLFVIKSPTARRTRGVASQFLRPGGGTLLAGLMMTMTLAPVARAADVYWDGGLAGTSATWRTIANWNPDGIPTAADNAIFSAAGDATTITIQMSNAGGLQEVGALTLDAGNFTPRSFRNNSTTFGWLELSGNNGFLLANYSAVQLSLLNQAAGFTSAAMGVRLAASGEIHVSTDGTSAQIVVSSSISETNGAQGFTKTGPGILYLQGTNNTFTGPVTNRAGSIKVNSTATFGDGTAPVYFEGGNLISGSDRSGGVPISNPLIVSSDVFIINDAGLANTSRTLPFSGPISGPGRITIANLTATADQTFLVRLVGGQTITNPWTIASVVDTVGSFAVLQLYNPATAGTLTLTGDIDGLGSLRREGAGSSDGGTAILTGNNTYAGGTIVAYGTLLANNLAGSALGSGAVLVTNAGILGGSGTITAPVAVSLGAAISPGASASSVGNLTLSDLTLGESGNYVVQIANAAGAAGVGYDTITVSGGWTDLASSSNAFTIKLDSLGVPPANWNPGTARSWTIIGSSSATGFDVSHFAIDTAAFVGTVQGIFSLDVVSGNLVLSYTPAADIIINVAAGSVTQGQTSPTPYPLLTGPFGVTKIGNGEVVLTNSANDYLGSTKVYAGTMSLGVDAFNNSGALGAASTAVILGNTIGTSNATFNISTAGVTMGRNLSVQSGSTGTKSIGTTVTSGTATYSGDIALQDNVNLTTPAGSDLVISGFLSGTGVATKSGSGTLTLNALNTHGGTTISNGTLIIGGQVGSAFTVAGSSILDNPGPSSRTLNATSVALAGDVTFTGTTNLSFSSAPVTVTGDRTITVVSNTLTIGGIISGAGGINKQGAGTLALTAAAGSDYAGNTTLNAGLTTIGASTTIGAGTLNLAGGTLGLTGTRNTSTGILPNPIQLTADTIVQNTTTAAAGTRNLPFGGLLTANAGTLTIRNIAAANVNVIHLRLHAGGINFSRSVVFDNSLAGSPVDNTARLGFYSTNPSAPQIFSGVISGPGSIIRSAVSSGTGGTTILTGENTFTLGAELFDGELGLGADASFAGSVLISGPLGTGTFEWTGNSGIFAHGAARDLPNNVFLNGVRLGRVTGTNQLTFSGLMNVGSVAKGFVIESTAPAIIAGVMTNTSPLWKDGPGVLVLAGPNQNSGPWAVTNGTLLVNGSSGSGDVTVYGPGVLGGSGTIAGAVIVEASGILSPGASGIGTLTLSSNLTFAGNGLFEVNKSLAPSNDVAIVAGVLTNAGTGTITINNLGAALTVGDSFQIFNKAVLNGSALAITGGGATWANNLETDGSVTVLSVSGAQPPPNFAAGGIATLPSGNISLTATGAMGATYKLWATTNVALTPVETTWTLLSSGTVTTSPFTLEDLAATNYVQRFYLFSAP